MKNKRITFSFTGDPSLDDQQVLAIHKLFEALFNALPACVTKKGGTFELEAFAPSNMSDDKIKEQIDLSLIFLRKRGRGKLG